MEKMEKDARERARQKNTTGSRQQRGAWIHPAAANKQSDVKRLDATKMNCPKKDFSLQCRKLVLSGGDLADPPFRQYVNMLQSVIEVRIRENRWSDCTGLLILSDFAVPRLRRVYNEKQGFYSFGNVVLPGFGNRFGCPIETGPNGRALERISCKSGQCLLRMQ